MDDMALDFLFHEVQKIYCLPGKLSLFQKGLFSMKSVSTHNDSCQCEMTVMDKIRNAGCIRHAWLESMDIVRHNTCTRFTYIIFSVKHAELGRISTNPAVLGRLLRKSASFVTHHKVYECSKLEWSDLRLYYFQHIKRINKKREEAAPENRVGKRFINISVDPVLSAVYRTG